MNDFQKACQEKFERGAKEHTGDWNAVNPHFEIREELCDLYNYSTLLKDKEMAVHIQQWAEEMWYQIAKRPQ